MFKYIFESVNIFFLAFFFTFASCSSVTSISTDSGTAPVDEGTISIDEGTAPVDEGTTSIDEGTTPVDEGTSSIDEGPAPVDEGISSIDEGSVTEDAGPVCEPDCEDKSCGSDGCGGECGECSGDTPTCSFGNCVETPCEPACNPEQECGLDTCGEPTCGDCGENGVCVGTTCVCIPDCGGKVCGPDGCGGQCGFGSDCPGDDDCVEGLCICTPTCTDGQECGLDSCGGNTCGTCPAAAPNCIENTCQPDVCEPACNGKECGEDGCGGSCGTCATQEVCTNDGQCLCEPSCGGKECGPDGCGGSCGSCTGNDECQNGQCVCIPDCSTSPNACGSDGCGGSCGSCAIGDCGGQTCECSATCSTLECGDSYGPFLLGLKCTGQCGRCQGSICNSNGACQCPASPTAAVCEGRCGSVCAQSCGGCGLGFTCNEYNYCVPLIILVPVD